MLLAKQKNIPTGLKTKIMLLAKKNNILMELKTKIMLFLKQTSIFITLKHYKTRRGEQLTNFPLACKV
jgi:hypothetical protein